MLVWRSVVVVLVAVLALSELAGGLSASSGPLSSD
jgi:hypothetical protein